VWQQQLLLPRYLFLFLNLGGRFFGNCNFAILDTALFSTIGRKVFPNTRDESSRLSVALVDAYIERGACHEMQ